MGKRRYVKSSSRIELTRDPVSGVLVLAQGYDLGARARERIAAGELAVVDREVTRGGVVISRGAYVRVPGRVDAIVASGAFDPPSPASDEAVFEARKAALDASDLVRMFMEQAKVRPRTTGVYQASSDRGVKELTDSQVRAREWLKEIARRIGWAHYSALMDAIMFEDPLSSRQEALVTEAVRRVASWRAGTKKPQPA